MRRSLFASLTRLKLLRGGDPQAPERFSFTGKKGGNSFKPKGYHSVFTYSPKDPNCEVCRMTKTTSARCKHRLLKCAEATSLPTPLINSKELIKACEGSPMNLSTRILFAFQKPMESQKDPFEEQKKERRRRWFKVYMVS